MGKLTATQKLWLAGFEIAIRNDTRKIEEARKLSMMTNPNLRKYIKKATADEQKELL